MSKIQSMAGEHSLGGAYGHSKAYGLSLFPQQWKLFTAGISGHCQHALGMLGRTLLGDIGWKEPQKFDKLATPEIIFNQCSEYWLWVYIFMVFSLVETLISERSVISRKF